MSDLDRAAKRLDNAIDRYGEKIGYATLELLLQKRAQDCREISLENDEMPTVGFDEIEGYSE
jgi:hypothetical protein